MLPIKLQRNQVEALMADADAGKMIDVDLESQTVTRADGTKYTFEIDPFRKHCLINGLDDISLTLERGSKIVEFEKKRTVSQPWFDSAAQPMIMV
jgi:3-isopropylmalate dehydratase small subunit